MSSEIHELSDVDRRILQLLFQAWQTPEQTKSQGVMRLNELVQLLATDPEELRGRMLLLESLGYVTNIHDRAGDPTLVYKGIDEHTGGTEAVTGDLGEHVDPAYFITDWGKKLVVAQIASEGGAASTA